MKSVKVYDLPTRVFHVLFISYFLFAFIIAKTTDDESLTFSYHMLSGMILGILVIWRIAWGFVGSKHARFSDFELNPKSLKEYFQGILSSSQKRWAGHNPASSWAALVMMGLTIGLVTTGYLMSSGDKEAYEDIHEIFANSFILIVIGHVLGVIIHTIRHKDIIGLSMLHGRKNLSDSTEEDVPNMSFSALVLIALVITCSNYLARHFDSQNRTLQVFGQTLQLGENEDEEGDSPNETEDKANSGSGETSKTGENESGDESQDND